MPDQRKLLIIDDCAEDRKMYRRYLLKDPHQSYEILEADSAQKGLALYQTMPWDIVLLDFCLPDMSGLEILDKLKQEKVEAASVIMLSGHGDEEVAVQAIKKGAQDYLVKQRLNPDVLQLAVRNVIKRSHSQTLLNKTRERQRLIATTALRIRQSLNLEQILTTAVAEVQQLLRCDRVVVYQSLSQTQSNATQELVDLILLEPCLCQEVVKNEKGKQILSKVCEAGSSINCPDFNKPEKCQLTHSFKEFVPQRETVANLVVPIGLSDCQEPNPQLWGLLVAHQCLGRQWQNSELDILNELSIHLAIAIQQAELLAQTQAEVVNAKKLNAFKSQIITTVSCEYRSPLASILAAASTLKQYGNRLNEFKQQKFLQTIEQKARHMALLVDDLLLFQKFELNKAKLQLQPLDLLHFFSDLVEEQRRKAGDRYELIFQMTGNNKGFSGDGGLLRQIFMSLASNAIKYSPDGGMIDFHLIGGDLQVIFDVKDRGIGIPIEDREELFQPFTRGSNVETIPGTGLGLAIAKACAELHGGDITLESQLGQGTKVSVTLPKQAISNN